MARKRITSVRRKRLRMQSWPVLVVKPHRVDFQTDERVSAFIMKAFERGICEYMPMGSKLPEYARNKGIASLLENPLYADKTHIFFLDADTYPVNDYAIERLLSIDKDVVCGVTPIKLQAGENGFALGWNVQRKREDGGHENYAIEELPDKPFKIDRVGGTTVLIKRHVLEKLEKPYQKTEFLDDFTNVKLSEDFYFSQKLTDAGFEIWCDPLTVCHHYHTVDLLDIFEVWKQAKKGDNS